jgi:hypothetical protein
LKPAQHRPVSLLIGDGILNLLSHLRPELEPFGPSEPGTRQTTVNDQVNTIHETGHVARQERGRAGDIVHFTGTPDGLNIREETAHGGGSLFAFLPV